MVCGTVRWLLACLCAYLCLFSQTCHGSFITDEESLRSALFSSYSVKVRPESTVEVTATATLQALNSLDISSQQMSVIVSFIIRWYDSRLVWNEATYGGLVALVAAPEDIWTPPIVIENAAADVGVLGGANRDATPLRFSSSGNITWYPTQEVTTSCEMTIANYPFDTQTCEIILLGWTYPVTEVSLTAISVDSTSAYVLNGEFDLVSTSTYYSLMHNGNDSYKSLHFELTYRRKWLFYGQNLLMPIVLNSILMNVVFLLPIDSGEKMGYSVTVLLSYIVFLTWVTDNLPPVSTDVSVLQVYLAVVFCLGCVATVLTMWVLLLHHTPESKPMNLFYRKSAHFVLLPFSNFLYRKNKSKSDENRREAGHPKMPLSKVRPAFSTHHQTDNETKLTVVEGNDNSVEHVKCEEEHLPSLPWQELATLFDNFFLYTFACCLSIVTLIIFTILYGRY